MARKDDRRKAGARSGKPRDGKPGRPARPGVKPPAAPPQPPKPKFQGKLLENEPLARHVTWRIGGPARYLALPADSEDVVRALELAQDRGLPWVVLGLGSNVLVKDGGFPGVVIRMGKGLDRFEMKGATAIVGAGMPTPILARRTAEAGFVGVERFIGIPGTVGGGIYMNAGCHGAEFAEIVTEVTLMDPKGKVKQLSRKQISFKYRSSNIEGIVLEAKLGLGEESPAKLKELQSKLLRWRKAGTPTIKPYAGTSEVTTAPAPMNAYSPSVTPQMIVALAPIEPPRFTSVRRYSFLRETWLRGFMTLVNTQEGPQNTSSSSSTPS